MAKQVVSEVDEQLDNFMWDSDESLEFFGVKATDGGEKVVEEEQEIETIKVHMLKMLQ